MSSHSGMSLPTSKRSACDRCRGQKLRCPPGENGAEACARCTRLGACCSFTQRTPAGRMTTPGRANSSGDYFASQPDKARHVRKVAHRTKSTSSISTCSTATTPLSHTRQNSLSPPSMYDHIPMTAPLPTHNATFTPFITDEGLDMFGSPPSWNSSFEETNLFAPCNFDSLTSSYAMQPFDVTPFPQPELQKPARVMSPEQLNPFMNNEARLLSLCLNLNDRYRQVSIDPTGQEELNDKLVGEALGHLNEFLAIIQCYASGWTDQSTGCATMQLSSIVVLNLVSTYFRLVTIYDKLFNTMSEQLSHTLAWDGSQALRLDALGNPVQQHMQIKILVHAILHQFEGVESMLGLPLEYRVTNKQDTCSGLFLGDDRLRSIVEALSSGRSSPQPHGDDFEVRSLYSLRHAIGRVQALVGP